jgi:diguanylate cyclase (GGDEF)-like protein
VTPRRILLFLLLWFVPMAAHAQAGDTLTLGTWKFHRGDNAGWAARGLDDRAWQRIRGGVEWEAEIGAYDGFGWYRREVALPEAIAHGPVGIHFGSVGDAFEVFWNGVRIGGSGGMPPEFVEGVQPILFWVPDSVMARARDGRHVVAVRVFNEYAYGGLISPVRVGRYDVMAARHSPRSVVIGGLVSFFLAIGVYHLAFFLRRRGARENLWFTVVCACVSVYGATYADPVQALVMPVINPYRLGVLALLAGAPFFLKLVNELFGLRGGRRQWMVILAFAASWGAALVLPLGLLSDFNTVLDAGMALGLLVMVARAWRASPRGTPHGRTLLVGTAAFSATLTYDVLSEYSVVPVAHLLPGTPSAFWLGYLVFVLCVGLATAGRWAVTEITALTDPMTELSRRHVLEDALRREAQRLRRTGGSLALVLIDLDHFKRINDTHGHGVGDQVLARVGRLIRSSARNLDLPARFGGEEFAVLLYDTDLAGALSFADRFRATLAEMRVPVPGGTVGVTASLGVAVGADLVDADALVAAADQALYRAKGSGRDRLVSITMHDGARGDDFVVTR